MWKGMARRVGRLESGDNLGWQRFVGGSGSTEGGKGPRRGNKRERARAIRALAFHRPIITSNGVAWNGKSFLPSLLRGACPVIC